MRRVRKGRKRWAIPANATRVAPLAPFGCWTILTYIIDVHEFELFNFCDAPDNVGPKKETHPMVCRFWRLLLSALLTFAVSNNFVRAGPSGWRDFDEASGRNVIFIGGEAPKLLGAKPFKAPVLKNNRYYLRYYVVFRRAQLDDGSGRIPIIQGGPYRRLLLINNREIQWLAKQVRTALWNRNYPTWYAILTYRVAYQSEKDGYLLADGRFEKKQVWVYETDWKTPWSGKRVTKRVRKTKKYWTPGPRERQGNRAIKEFLLRGLEPGTHLLELRARASADDEHIFGKLLWGFNWVKFILDPIPGLNDWAYYAKKIAKSGVKATRSAYYIHVPAIVPDLSRFSKPSEAYQEIERWSLKPIPVKQITNDRSKNGRIASQWPRAGAWVRRDSRVRFRYYAYAPRKKETAQAVASESKKSRQQNESLMSSWVGRWHCVGSGGDMYLTVPSTKVGAILSGTYEHGYGGRPASEDLTITESGEAFLKGTYVYTDTNPRVGPPYKEAPNGARGKWPGRWSLSWKGDYLQLFRDDDASQWTGTYKCSRS